MRADQVKQKGSLIFDTFKCFKVLSIFNSAFVYSKDLIPF